jgi:lipid-binding SYLF domain-containing protein
MNTKLLLPYALIILFVVLLFEGAAQAKSDFWQQTNGPYGGEIHSLAINSSGDVFAGTFGGGVFRSTDNGNSWINTYFTNQTVVLVINSSGDIFAGTFGSGVFRSTDNGDTWSVINNGLTNTSVRALAINNSSGAIFAGTTFDGLFRSTDNGDTWNQTGLTNIGVLALAINSNGDIFAGTFGRSVSPIQLVN